MISLAPSPLNWEGELPCRLFRVMDESVLLSSGPLVHSNAQQAHYNRLIASF